jgi:outer membrane protein assembly factor BamA
LYLASRPPIETIVSTDGSIYGGSALRFSDLFGDYTFFLMAYQVRQYRSYQFSFLNQKRRLQYMVNAFQYTQFYYLNSYYDSYSRLTYADATAVRKITGASLSAYYPFNKYYRTQASIGYFNYEEDYLYLSPGTYAQFLNGNILSASFSLVGETTRFKSPYGPIAGNTFMLSVSQALPVSSSFLQNTTVETDLRKYIRIGSNTLFAFRFKGFLSRGKNPFVFYWGGNNQVRSVGYYTIIANEGWYANLEFRFPLINAASTIIGQIGPVRGAFFFDITRSKIKGYPAKIPIIERDEFGRLSFREIEAIGSYGYGFQFFFLGLPIHIEFVKRLEFPDISKPWDWDKKGNFRTRFWIGFDF